MTDCRISGDRLLELCKLLIQSLDGCGRWIGDDAGRKFLEDFLVEKGAAHGLCQIAIKPVHVEIGRSPIDADDVAISGHVSRVAGGAGQAQMPPTARYFNGVDGESDRKPIRVQGMRPISRDETISFKTG